MLEAPTATVVVLLDGALLTPPLDTGILAGTTVAAVPGIETAALSADDLARATEVMLLSSVRGVAPVRLLDGRELPVDRGRAMSEAFERSLR